MLIINQNIKVQIKRAKLVSEKYLDDALALIEEHGTNDPYEILENLGVVVIPIHIGAAF